MAIAKRAYKLTSGDRELFDRASNPNNGVGVNYFCQYYFGRELVPWQWYFHHARQLDVTVIGGVGSGKTTGAGMSYAAWAATTPGFIFANFAPTGWQSKLMFDIILREAGGGPFEKFIFAHTTRPYPMITLKNDHIGESRLYFLSASDDAKRAQGIEVDAVNIDEAGQILNPFQLMAMVATRMRGSAAVGAGVRRARLKKLSMITASYLEAPPWLWQRMDMAYDEPENFLSMQVGSAEAGTLSDEDLNLYRRRVPQEQQGALLGAGRPDGGGPHFSLNTVGPCEDLQLNRQIQYHLLEKETPTEGWNYEEAPGIGCILYEKPPEPHRQYLMAGDPGQGDPPHRNAPVIFALDITDFPEQPAEVVYFRWIFGRGSYEPFKADFYRIWQKYKPDQALVDSTGSQSLWDEQILLSLGIWATGMSFSAMKNPYLQALIQMIERRRIRFPYIQGIRSQLVRYDITNDEKMAQDIVATLMMVAYAMRSQLWDQYQEESRGDEPIPWNSARNTRTPVVTARTMREAMTVHRRERKSYEDLLREIGFDIKHEIPRSLR